MAIFKESYLFLQLTEAWHQTKETEDWKPCLNSLVPSKGKVTVFTNIIRKCEIKDYFVRVKFHTNPRGFRFARVQWFYHY